jgi:hypothetical protein
MSGCPVTIVLDVSEGHRRVLARQGVLAPGIALHREVVEPALLAEHVEVFGEIRTIPIGATALAFPRREVILTMGAWLESHPLRNPIVGHVASFDLDGRHRPLCR